MIYLTGDIHGDPQNVVIFCKRMRLTKNDTVILLGDVGANYYGDERDELLKNILSALHPAVLCVHGNHEKRPERIGGYSLVRWKEGRVWVQEKHPNLFFARDGDIYRIEEHRFLVIGGAYSVDKYHRLAAGAGWWDDEQPSEEIRKKVERQIASKVFDHILSHTCPYKYIPREMFLPGIDQSSVDDGTERWLDGIEEKAVYKAWYCGHWHTDKRIDRIHFLFRSFESIEKDGNLNNE